MKTIRIITRLILLPIGLNWLSAGCGTQKDDQVRAANDCRIQHSASSFHSQGNEGTIQLDYAYDAQGKLTNKTKISQSSSSTVASDKTTTTDTYTYDAAGFLTRSVTDIQQQYMFVGKPSEYHYVSTKTYSYTNERLAAYAQTDVTYDSHITSGPQPQTSVMTTSYTYDSSGQLIKQTSSNEESITYQNGKAFTLTSGYLFERQDGLVVKATFPGTDSRGAVRTLVQVNEYDTHRRLMKHQEYINDSLSTYYTQEWQTGQPAESSLPTFKGHPTVFSLFGEPGLLTRYRAYSVNNQHQIVQYTEQTFTHQLNAAGYIIGTKQISQALTNGPQQPDLSTISYTYTGCQ
ncbi:hypothetical protein [Spirosoma endophyticum]|uniref:YD repeat-containing protein n=1 Tax=Spirosoma endophyticum TaxID=662367 RepID=A0A1I1Z8D8_9BACT|nr:hypothetical protein [Spirosoma endophyticum]SFE27568.1 YD repeat-containing protein [Spirosoma endophyticum]